MSNLPSYMHLAQIMEEKTEIEKETFGKVQLNEIKMDDQNDAISQLIQIYIVENKDPKELLNQCITRSRDRFQREYAKLNAFYVNLKFFTEEGVKERAQSLKYKFLLKERFPECKKDADIKELSTFDRALSMLIIHNTKISKIQAKYKAEMDGKARAKE